MTDARLRALEARCARLERALVDLAGPNAQVYADRLNAPIDFSRESAIAIEPGPIEQPPTERIARAPTEDHQ